METNLQRTWKPTTVGILNIVYAVLNLWFFLGISLEGAVFWSIFTKSIFRLNSPSAAFITIVIPFLCMNILTLTGGIYALKRKRWRLALAGSITAIFSWTPLVLATTPALVLGIVPLGIFVVILIVKSKDEFE